MKKANKKVNASIIIVGNEILSGRTQDVNVSTLSKWLNELGVKVEEVRIVPDNETAIIHTVNFTVGKSSLPYLNIIYIGTSKIAVAATTTLTTVIISTEPPII